MPPDASAAAIFARAQERLAAIGKTQKEASTQAGGVHILSNLRKGSAPSPETLIRLAEALETTAEYLAFGIVMDDTPVAMTRLSNFPPMDTVPIIGEVAAGLWLEVDTAIDESPYSGVAVPPDPAYPIDVQFACVSRGTSVNRVAPDGSVLGCVDIRKAKIRPRNGDLVIAEQSRNGGHELMRTAKRYKEVPGGTELWPDSDDPKWREPIRIRRGQDDESLTVIVIGLVTWVHRPLDRSERPQSDEP